MLSPHARIIRTPRLQCNNTSRFVLNNALEGTYQVATHATCVCNELVALYNRHLVDRTYIGFDKTYYKRMARTVASEFQFEAIEPINTAKFIARYQGPKKMAYVRALANIQTHGFLPAWANVKMFVKPDKYAVSDAMTKAPRAIQYRSPEFNLLLGKFLQPIEEWFYHQSSPSGFRFVAKGLNNVERAVLLRDISDTYDAPVFILLDHKAYDSTINVEHIKSCHRLYGKCNSSRRLKNLLRYQLRNKGYSRHGIKYVVEGTRMSGDFDTALGNTIVNYITLRSWLKKHQVRGDIILDGDDSVVIVERSSLGRLDPNHFKLCGFETKMQVVHQLVDVEFCQGKYLPCDPPRFARNPIRALSRLNISVRDYHGSGWRRYQAGVGLAETAVSQGVPILHEVGRRLAALSSRPIHDTETYYKTLVNNSEVEITPEVRVAFHEAWGISPEEQRLIESTYTPHIRSAPHELIQQYLSLDDAAEETPLAFPR